MFCRSISCPEAAILDIDTLDPYSCLFFDLCD